MGTKRILYWICTSCSTMRLHGTSTCTCKWHGPDPAYYLLSTPTLIYIARCIYSSKGYGHDLGQIPVFFF